MTVLMYLHYGSRFGISLLSGFLLKLRKKIRNMLEVTRDVLSVEAGHREDRHFKIQVELNLAKPLL